MVNFIEKYQCTGCTACASVCPKQCISMIKDDEGFNYPHIDESKCIQCNLCETVCPVIHKQVLHTDTKSHAAINNDEEIRLNSTSGGIFTLLAQYVLDKNGYVIGAAYDEQFTVRHIIINNINDVYKLRGAKYSQSELGDTFIIIKELLDKDNWVLFSGTPCQVGGLKSFLRKDYDKLVTVDLICHGVPSPMVWSKYLKYRLQQDSQSKINNINLRSKISGWSKYNYSVVFDYDHSQYQTINSNDIYMKSFVSDICLRPSCSQCSFKGIYRVSDFTLGDYWGVWDQLPDMDDNKGTSLVFVHSELGRRIFNEIDSYIRNIEVNSEEAIKMNPSMIMSSPKNSHREEFMNDIRDKGFSEDIMRYFPIANEKEPFFNKVKRKIKRLLIK